MEFLNINHFSHRCLLRSGQTHRTTGGDPGRGGQAQPAGGGGGGGGLRLRLLRPLPESSLGLAPEASVEFAGQGDVPGVGVGGAGLPLLHVHQHLPPDAHTGRRGQSRGQSQTGCS